jgi:Ca2+-binding RTX toxin-like protein
VNASAATGNVTVSDGYRNGRAFDYHRHRQRHHQPRHRGLQRGHASTGNDTVNVNGTTIGSTIDAGVGDTDDLNVASWRRRRDGSGRNELRTVTLLPGTTFTANDTANLTINGSATADVITTGNAVQTVNAGAGNDIITLGCRRPDIKCGRRLGQVFNATTIASTIAAGEADGQGRHPECHRRRHGRHGRGGHRVRERHPGCRNHLHRQRHCPLIINGSTGADVITTGNARRR